MSVTRDANQDTMMKIELPPRCAEKFRAESLLGAGGFSQVFLAVQRELDRPVALKILRAGEVLPGSLERFEMEARLTASLNHPHIVKIVDHQVEGDVGWIAYELLEGPSLRELLQQGLPTLEVALDAATAIASALQVAHEAGILHRDVKPENVMRDTSGAFKVTDFGIAKASGGVRTEAGMVLGTPQYIAPDLLLGNAASERSDIYSFGVLLHELVTGVCPFPGEDVPRLLRRKMKEDPPAPSTVRPGIPSRLERLILDCLARDPGGRPGSMSEVIQRLQGIPLDGSDHFRVDTRRVDTREDTPRVTRRLRPGSPAGAGVRGLVIGVTLFLLAGLGVVLATRSLRLPPEILALETEARRVEREQGPRVAVDVWRRLVALAPEYLPAHLAYADCVDRLDLGDEAVQAYRAAIALDPGNVEPRHRLATILSTQGRITEARQMLEELLAGFPDSSWARVQLACIEYHNTGNRGRAMDCFRQVAEQDLEGANVAKVMLGVHSWEEGDKVRGEPLIRESSDARAGPVDSWRYTVNHLVGHKQIDEAREHLARLFAPGVAPRAADYVMGYMLESVEGNADAMIEWAEKGFLLGPDSLRVSEPFLGTVDRLNRCDRLLKILDVMKIESLALPVVYRVGLSLEVAGHHEKALQCFTLAEASPDLAIFARPHRALQLLRLKKGAEANALITAYMNERPEGEQVEKYQAMIGYLIHGTASGRSHEAYLREQVKRYPQSFTARMNLVQVVFDTADPQELDGHLASLLAERKDLKVLWSLQGRNLARLRRFEDAEVALRRAAEGSQDPWNRYYMARFLHDVHLVREDWGKLEEARRLAQSIIQDQPGITQFQGLLAEIEIALVDRPR